MLPALPDTFLLEPVYDEDGAFSLAWHPVIGWTHAHGSLLHPLTYANVSGRAVKFPDGSIMDRQLRRTFENLDDWASAIRTEDPAPAPISAGTVEIADPSFQDLNFSTRAINALKTGLNADRLSDLTRVNRAFAEALRGVSPQTILLLTDELLRRGWSWAETPRAPAPVELDDADALL